MQELRGLLVHKYSPELHATANLAVSQCLPLGVQLMQFNRTSSKVLLAIFISFIGIQLQMVYVSKYLHMFFCTFTRYHTLTLLVSNENGITFT